MGRVVAKKINSIFASIATTIHIVKKIMVIQIISGSKVITFLYIFVNNLYLDVQLDCCGNSERKCLRKQSERGIKLRGPSPKGLKSMSLRTANSYRI